MSTKIRIITFITCAIGLSARAQTTKNTHGIHFEQTLKWSEILAKAKKEHKYIFVDCYATWCGPCKQMEQSVYQQKAVGEVFNKDLISVKLQMDKTQADDSITKARYSRAELFEKNYTINAYPTFLFFDREGKPVHKVTGALNEKQFIQLAKDAQNPDKQYYAILKNFQPNKLDTADEKGLALAFLNSDKSLATKIAADYLRRVPKSRLKTYESGRLMVVFQNDPTVLDIAANYIASWNKREFAKKGYADFISALSQQPKVKELAIEYIAHLSNQQIAQADNKNFISWFRGEIRVQEVADRYIEQLPENDRYNRNTILFIANFTRTTQGPAFDFFYKNTAHIDSIVKDKRYAQGKVNECITRSVWQPLFTTAKTSGTTPDFDKLAANISSNYTTDYAQKITQHAKVDWYSYLVHEKKQSEYWPQLTWAMLDWDRPFLSDATANIPIVVNNDCYDSFKHSDDPQTLSLADSLMGLVVKKEPDLNCLDTYACILYKLGKTSEAVTEEEKALESFDNKAQPVIAANFQDKIEAMKRGDKIWLNPAFQ